MLAATVGYEGNWGTASRYLEVKIGPGCIAKGAKEIVMRLYSCTVMASISG